MLRLQRRDGGFAVGDLAALYHGQQLRKRELYEIKELLSTPATLNQIAEKTGYYNSLAMIRVFKRYEGETPGKYREKLTP